MRILYPDDPLGQRTPDEVFQLEYEAARCRGFEASIFSLEDFERGRFNPLPRPTPGEVVLYRGWMLNLSRYAELMKALAQLSVQTVVALEKYRAGHHLPAWYPQLRELTSETLIFDADTDFATALAATNWSGYFVKDYVKSLTTRAGSLVRTPAEVPNVVAQLRKYRGEIEGGVCVRREEAYVPGSESRYFVVRGQACTSDGRAVPDIVQICAERIASPFFSVDVALRDDGVLRVIEIGDGQVSDRKEWSAQRLVEILRHLA